MEEKLSKEQIKAKKKAELQAKYSAAGEKIVGPCLVGLLASKLSESLTVSQITGLKNVMQEIQLEVGGKIVRGAEYFSESKGYQKEIDKILSEPMSTESTTRLAVLKKSQEAKVSQMRGYLNEIATTKRLMEMLERVRDADQPDIVQTVLTSIYGGTSKGGKVLDSIEGRYSSLSGYIKEEIESQLIKYKGIEESHSLEIEKQVVTELHNMMEEGYVPNKNSMIVDHARAYMTGIQRLVAAKKALGTGFQALRDFFASWSNNPRLVTINAEQWKQDSLKNIDFKKSFDLDLTQPTDMLKANKILDEFVQGCKDNPLVPGLKSSFWGGKRVFHYRSPEIALEHMRKYSGFESLREAIDSTVDRQSKAIAVEGILGPRPKDFMDRIKEMVDLVTPYERMGKVQGSKNNLDTALKGVLGHGSIGDNSLVDILSGVKAFASSFLLGRSIFKQGLDGLNNYLVRNYMTGELSPLNYVKALCSTIRYALPTEESKEVARGVGLHLQGFHKAYVDSVSENNMKGKITGFLYKMAERAARIQLLTPWTGGSQVGAGAWVSTYAKRVYEKGAVLNGEELNIKKSIGLSNEEEAIVQQAIASIPENRSMLFLKDIYGVLGASEESKSIIAQKIGSFYYNQISDMAGMPGWKIRTEQGSQAVSKNESGRLVRDILWTFKGPAFKSMMVIGKTLRGMSKEGKIDLFTKGGAAVASAATMAVSYKYASDYFLSIAEDKEPPELTVGYVADAFKQYTAGPFSDWMILYDTKRGKFGTPRTSIPMVSYTQSIGLDLINMHPIDAMQTAINLDKKEEGAMKFRKFWMVDLYLFGQNIME